MSLRDFLKRSSRRAIPKPIFDAALRPAVRGILRLAFGSRGYKINIGGHGIFRLSPDFVFRGWEDFGNRHNSGFAQCIEACAGKASFLDVGAHVGLYSLPVSRVLAPGGRVYAFEPAEGSYRYLQRHITYNGVTNICPYQLVVGDMRKDSVPFYEHVVASSALSGLTKRIKRRTDRYVEKPRSQIALDDFCAEHRLAPDVIKIDVEGAELLVLRGAKSTLARHGPMLFLSVHPAHLEAMGQSTEELADLLRDMGYEILDTNRAPTASLGSGEYVCDAVTGSRASP